MKASYYNFIVERKQGNQKDGIYYNARTGSFSYLNEEYHKQFQDFLNKQITISDDKFLNDLKYCGLIVEDDFDEMLDIRMKMLHSKYDTSVLSLTIAPTMACNFRCVYCFEQGHYENGNMTEETEDDICEFVMQEVRHLEKLSITWYGGEPLLAIEIVERLSKKLQQICARFEVEYESSMITNGYLLSEEVCDRLLACGIDDVQITLDGGESVHDKRRILANGSKTYHIIMENLQKIHGKIRIAIRINIDSQSKEHVQQLIEQLKIRDIYQDVFCYLAFVTETNGICRDCNSMSNEKYSKFNLQFLIENNIPLENFYPKPIGNYCGADYVQGYVIDPKGNMYKCWSDIGIQERTISTLKQWLYEEHIQKEIPCIQTQKIMCEYMMYDPTMDEHCKQCNILPICMGGCPHSRIEKKQRCEQYRYHIYEYMETYAETLLQKRGEVR